MAGTALQPASAADSDRNGIEEIVVTTRYREEKLQEVPIPLAVVSGVTMTNTDTFRLQDIGALLPSVNVMDTNARQNSFAVRGIGNNPANEGLYSSTGVFLDGVYLGRPGMALFDMTDIERIELARGPQGTLSGKNTTAGALNILTEKPSFTFGGSGEVTLGNYSDREFRTDVTAPLVGDKLAGRISAYSTERDGFVFDPHNDQDYYGYFRQGVRTQLLARPDDKTSIRFIAEYDKEDDTIGPPLPYAAPTDPNAPFWQYINTLKQAAALNGVPFYGPSFPVNPNARQIFIDSLYRNKVSQGGLTALVDRDLGDGYNLSSITGYRFWNSHPYNDGDNTSLPADLQAGLMNHDRQFSQELRLTSPAEDRFNYAAGLYFFTQHEHAFSGNYYGSNLLYLEDYLGSTSKASYTPASPAVASTYINNVNATTGFLNTYSYAAYSQANFRITDALTLTGGIRDTYERQTLNLIRNFNGTPPTSPTDPSLQTGSYATSTNNVAGTAALDYKVNSDLNVYTSYAHGAKAGALNNLPPSSAFTPTGIIVKPETADDGELGFKSSLFDHTLMFNANLYYTVILNYQATGTYFDPLKPPAGATSTGLTNVGAVSSKGVELDNSWRVLPSLTLGFNGSYNDAFYRSYHNGACPYENPGTATVCDLTGKPVVGAPRWIGSLTGQYETPVANGVLGYTRAEYNYRSSFYGPGVSDDSIYSLNKAYGLTNFWVGVRLEKTGLDVSFWMRNAFNVKYTVSTQGGGPSGYYTATPGDPRTFGGTVRLKF